MMIKSFYYDFTKYIVADYKNDKNGNIYFVYVCNINNTYYKLVTTSKWDYKVTYIKSRYLDNKNQDILCFELNNKKEWNLY
jgi:hypothetical protein